MSLEGLDAAAGQLTVMGPVLEQARAEELSPAGTAGPAKIRAGRFADVDPRTRPGPPGTPRIATRGRRVVARCWMDDRCARISYSERATGTNMIEDRMSTRLLIAAAGLALAMFVVGAAPAAAQEDPPAERPAAKEIASLVTPSEEAAQAVPGSLTDVLEEGTTSRAEAARLTPDQRAPSAIAMSPPRPLGQTSRIQKVTLPTRVDPKSGRQVVVISNSDLERLYGTSVVPVSSSASRVDPASGSAPRDDSTPSANKKDAGAGESGADNAARAAAIDAEINRLNDNARALANPFLPPPKLTEAEKSALDGKDNKERIDMTRERIQELRQEKSRLESSPSGTEPSGR